MAFETKYTCGACSHAFYRVTERDPRKTKGRHPACPECRKNKKVEPKIYIKSNKSVDSYKENESAKEREENFNQKIAAGEVGFSIGGANLKNKNVDKVAEMVMQDYGMTDIKLDGSLREGDTCVPNLQGTDGSGVSLEQRSRDVFAPQKPLAGQQSNGTLNKTLMKQINSGMFKAYGGADDVVAKQQASGMRPKVNIVHDYDNRK